MNALWFIVAAVAVWSLRGRSPAPIEKHNFGGTATPMELGYTDYLTAGGTLNFDQWQHTEWLLGRRQ